MSTGTPHIYPKTNISKVYYKHVVDQIEHEPLIKHSVLSVACMLAAVCVLAGALLWYTKSNPGNLVQTTGTITGVNSGKTDNFGGTTTFVTFEFDSKIPAPVDQKTHLSVRQPVSDDIEYKAGETIRVGYNPKNPYFARNLADNTPPLLAMAFWSVPFILMIWLIFLALYRHHARQVEIWNAAEAAGIDE